MKRRFMGAGKREDEAPNLLRSGNGRISERFVGKVRCEHCKMDDFLLEMSTKKSRKASKLSTVKKKKIIIVFIIIIVVVIIISVYK